MGYLIEAKYEGMEYWDRDREHIKKFGIINNKISLLKLYLSYLESNKKEYQVNVRPNQRFYVTCGLHNTQDLSLTISESDKIWVCYGCGCGGSIIDFVMRAYDINIDNIEKALNVLMCFCNNTPNELLPEEKKIYDELFIFYNDPDKEKYFLESMKKTEKINTRINNYCNFLEQQNRTINCRQIANRLCCSTGYVTEIIRKKSIK